MSRRKLEKDYHELAKSRWFKWVGEVLPKHVKYPTWWECKKCGYRWEARYNSIQQGTGCPVCKNRIPKIEKDYHDLAESRGFKWVGVVLPKDTHDPTLWECEDLHRWKTQYSSIHQGRGCSVCFGNAKKIEIDYHKLAKSRGFKWVGEYLPKATRNPTWWECEKGDRWKARYHDIQQGDGCPVCSNKAKKIEQDYHELAKSRGFKWVGGVLPKNVLIPTWWECEKGHRWKTKYNIIQQGSGCTICKDMINGAIVSKPQRKLNNLLCGSLNYPEGKYRIDVAIMRKSQKIAVEYDCWYWHQGREEHDAKRDSFLVSRSWKVLHIRAGELVPIREELNIAIKHLLDTNDAVYNLYLEDWKN